ncbi:hypothetical protein [Hydrogenimonas sp.]
MTKMWRWVLLALLATGSLWADKVKTTAVACPTMEAFEKIRAYHDDTASKELYIMQQGCTVLTPNDKIRVIDPEKRVHGTYVKVQVDRTNEILYVNARYIKIEQAGSGNILRF